MRKSEIKELLYFFLAQPLVDGAFRGGLVNLPPEVAPPPPVAVFQLVRYKYKWRGDLLGQAGKARQALWLAGWLAGWQAVQVGGGMAHGKEGLIVTVT